MVKAQIHQEVIDSLKEMHGIDAVEELKSILDSEYDEYTIEIIPTDKAE